MLNTYSATQKGPETQTPIAESLTPKSSESAILFIGAELILGPRYDSPSPTKPTGTLGEETTTLSNLLRLHEGMWGTGSSCVVTHWAEPG